ncbi:MAG: hypothetical protein V3R55_02295 [Alphaproteobacteria bacterium]
MTRLRGMRAIALALLLAVMLAASLDGCGKKARPEPPPGEKSEFPRQYPR